MDYSIWLNGEYFLRGEAKISMLDRGFRLGDVIFDTSRTFNGKIFKLRDHLKRLYRSLQYTRIDPGMSIDEMEHVTLEVVERNESVRELGDDYMITQMVTRGEGGLDLRSMKANVAVYIDPIAQFLSMELGNARLMVLGTYRDMELSRQHPLAETLGELTRSAAGGFQRMLLRGLTLEDVGSFIELTSGMLPPGGLVEAVHTQTEGNPLFVTEVVRLLVQEGELSQERESWDVRIPEGVREVIGRRLNRLSARCNEAMTVAAVLGREFELSHLRPLIEDTTENQLLDTLEEALGSRVIEELPQAVGSYRFTHALIRHTLTDELTTTRRVRLHAGIGEALEQLYGDEVEAHAAQLAYHFGEAEPVLGNDKLAKYSAMAGEHALAARAYEEALVHFKRALAAEHGEAADEETAQILYGLGRAQAGSNQVDEAVSSFTGAFDYYAESGDTSWAVAIAEYAHSQQMVALMEDIIARALRLVPSDSHEAGRLLSTYGLSVAVTARRFADAQEAFDRAVAIAVREGDTALEIRTLANNANVAGQQLSWDECLEKALGAIELAGIGGDALYEIRARLWVCHALLAKGETGKIQPHAAALLEQADRLRDRYWIGLASNMNSAICAAQGDWRAMRTHSDLGLEAFPAQPGLLGIRALQAHQVGESELGQVYLERLLTDWSGADARTLGPEADPVLVTALVAGITGKIGRFEFVQQEAGHVLTSLSNPREVVSAKAGLGLIAVSRGEASVAHELYVALELHSGTMSGKTGLVSTDRILALLAHTFGKLDDSAAHFQDALAFCRKAGYRPELAWSLCDYADLLKERDGPGDQEKATVLLDESLAISRELGMRPLMERVESRLDALH